MVEGARLEIVYAATYRGFESPSLRHELSDETHHFDRRKEARSLGRAGHFAFLRAPESAIRGGGGHSPKFVERTRWSDPGRV